MPAALDDDQLGVRDRPRHRARFLERDDAVFCAVDDERGARDLPQTRRDQLWVELGRAGREHLGCRLARPRHGVLDRLGRVRLVEGRGEEAWMKAS